MFIQTQFIGSHIFPYFSILSSSGDLQPSTAIANQLPGQLVYTQITNRGPNCFKFIIALIMPAETSYKQKSNCLILYMLHHKACNAEAESIMSEAYTHTHTHTYIYIYIYIYIQLACHKPTTV